MPLTAALTYIAWGGVWGAKKQSLLYIDFLSENPTIPRNHPIRVKQTQNIYLQVNVYLIFFYPGVSTVAFDTRLGLYDDSPPPEALLFIKEVQNFFALSHKLLFSAVSRFARQYFDTPLLKRFLKCGDTILDIGQGFVDKKMKELKEMTEKGIDPSDNSQGLCCGLSSQ